MADHGRQVLIVEDDPDIREALKEVLADNAYEPIVACNGAEALVRLHSPDVKPCLILLDIMMPVMNGWEFRAKQKNDPELGDIPVVVLTAHASAEQAAREMDAAGFLKKPVRLVTLLSTIERYCRTS